jgi:hypothetical protein
MGGNQSNGQSVIAVNERSMQITNESESAIDAMQDRVKQTSA